MRRSTERAFEQTESVAFPHPRSLAVPVFSSRPQGDDKMKSLAILYVEDYKLILLYVKEILEAQGWCVETCQDGISALEKIEGATSYDVFILDNSLPGLSGVELVRRARCLAHRRRTPIIMLSASGTERAALQAGANLFLKKPDEVEAIADAVTRLIGLR